MTRLHLKHLTLTTVTCLVALATSGHAAIWYVNQYASGENDGTTWGSAYTNLQSALTSATAGDSIWVAQGTYTPHPTDYTLSFTLKPNVQLIGGFAGVETSATQANWQRHITTLSGDIGTNVLHKDNTRRLVRAPNATNAVLDGFVIADANAFTNHFDSIFSYDGAGLYITGAPITVRRALFRNNIAATGGAIYSDAGATISHCIFSNNAALNRGGAIQSWTGDMTIDNSVFVDNRMYASGSGAALAFADGDLLMRHCTFLTNFANTASFGGNLLVFNLADAVIRNSIFWGRSQTNSYIRDQGGAICIRHNGDTNIWARSADLANCIVQDGFPPPTNATVTGILSADPIFVDTLGRNTRLQAGSPAIDQGTAGGTVSPDFDGITRPQGAGPDIGAYEYTASPPTQPLPVASASAVGQRGRVELTWTNPADLDFAGVLVVSIPAGQSALGAPANGHAYSVGARVANGTVIYVGPGTNGSPSAASAFTHTNLPPQTDYTYNVYAYNTATNHAPAWVGNATTLSAPPPPNPIAATGGDKQIELEWNNPDAEDEAQGILILRRADEPPTSVPSNTFSYSVGDVIGDAEVAYFGFGTNTSPLAATGWINTNLAGTTTFYYHLFTADGGPNYSEFPTELSATTFSMPNIDSLTATALEHGADFTWHNTDDPGFSGVLVLRSDSGPPNTPPVNMQVYSDGDVIGNAEVAYRGPGLDGTPNANSGWSETDFLVSQTTYYYSFQGIDSQGNYALPILHTNITTTADVTPPGPVTTLSVDVTGIGTATLNWNNPADVDFRNVLIVRRTDPLGPWSPTPGQTYSFGANTPAGTVVYAGPGNNNSPSAANSVVDNFNLQAGQQYFYGVYAYDVANLYAPRATDDVEFPPANTIFVNHAAVLGGNVGTSWQDAYTNLQTALAAASSSNQIWVAQGTYKPTEDTNRDARFLMKAGLGVYGGFSGIESRLSQRRITNHPTILSGDIGTIGASFDNSKNIVSFLSGTDGALLSGFLVVDGQDGITIPGGSPGGCGVWMGSASRVENCEFSGHASPAAPALHIQGANATVRNCLFRNNSGGSRSGALQTYGSGFSPLIENCVFYDNFCGSVGGALALYHGTPQLRNCTFIGNTASEGGNCAYISNGGSPTFLNCILWDIGNDGGGILAKRCNEFNCSGPVSVINCDVRGGVSIPVDLSGTIMDNINVDPQFVDEISRDLHLVQTSPCIDAATASGAPTDDFDGGSRPAGDGYDLGAYEYGSTGPGTPPEALMLIVW